jgi:hypothetical protein
MAHSSVRGVDLGVHACIHMLRVWCRGTCVKCRQSGHLCDGRGGGLEKWVEWGNCRGTPGAGALPHVH